MTKFKQTVNPWLINAAYIALFLIPANVALQWAQPIMRMAKISIDLPSVSVLPVVGYCVAVGLLCK